MRPQHHDTFYQLGKFIFVYRWFIIALMLAISIACLPLAPRALTAFTATGFISPASESAKAASYLKKHLPFRENQFIIMYQGKKSFTEDPQFSNAIKYSLSGLDHFPIQSEIIYPDNNKNQVSKDKKSAYAIVILKGNQQLSKEQLTSFKKSIKKPPGLKILIGGEPIFLQETNQQTKTDLIQAEYIATPIAMITLLIIFGSLTGALVPLILDGVCALFILTILALLGNYCDLSVFTLNIALLLGLCLSLDYALFIISRFREELSAGQSVENAIAITQATAGKSVFFSGLAVLASLSALLFFPINILFSVGIGGMTAVGIAVIVCIIALPALLAVLKHRINFLPIKFLAMNNGRGIWLRAVSQVVRYPWTYMISIILFLFFLGAPFLQVVLGISDYKILPTTSQSRQVFDIFKTKFSEEQLTPIVIVIKSKQQNILSPTNIGHIHQFVQRLRADKRILRVDSIVTTTPSLTTDQYKILYQNRQHLPRPLNQLLKLTTGDKFTFITVISKNPGSSQATTDLIKKIRNMHLNSTLTLEVTGGPANTIDVLATIKSIFPYALLWIIMLSYLILLILLRSIILPIKAIIMNMLSLFASYGVLVFIIQQGYFSRLLNFEPQGMIDISLLIIIFCALFGFSMDYEVFLLSRIKEYYEKSGNNIRSICYGIAYSSKIITSAAVIVILICFSFISADILMVKAFGLGIAIAIFVDAFLIRTILVPATMAILKNWNWYLPKWLSRLLPDLSFTHKDK